MAEPPSPRGVTSRVLFALKPASWPKLLVPMALGHALGAHAAGRLSGPGLAFGAAFTVLDLAFIVLLNDWGDAPVDRLKRTMFPASSAKTIPDGVLPARALLGLGLLAGALALAVAGVAERALPSPGLASWALGALALFVAYTLPPVRLNYRGGGELLEGLGVGVVLPWLNARMQGGPGLSWSSLPLVGYGLASLASGIASGLSDERSDRAGGKRTFATARGNAAARRLSEALVVTAGLAWLGSALVVPDRALRCALVVGAVVCLAGVPSLVRASGVAVTDAFDAQRRYKGALHACLWGGALALAAALCVADLVSASSRGR